MDSNHDYNLRHFYAGLAEEHVSANGNRRGSNCSVRSKLLILRSGFSTIDAIITCKLAWCDLGDPASDSGSQTWASEAEQGARRLLR
jgi:hypothetical protein